MHVIECLLNSDLQGLEGGWRKHYNYRCQPVDYTRNPIAMRVSISFIQFKINYSRWYLYGIAISFDKPNQIHNAVTMAKNQCGCVYRHTL